MRYGNAEASCYGYGIYAILQAAVLGDVEGGVAFSQLAIRLNEKLGAVKLEGSMFHLLGDHVNFWKNSIAPDLPILERGFSACVRGGDNIYSNYIGFQAPWHPYESGAPLADVMALTEKSASFARVTKYAPVVWTLRAEQQFLRMGMGAPAAGALGSVRRTTGRRLALESAVMSSSSEILIVEDDQAIRDSLTHVLRDEGFTVATAENGLDALGYLEAHGPPCVIVLDLMMPVMSGREFREKQLADPRFASIPVIVMSAADLGSIIAAQLHANGYFAKPPDVNAMIATLTRYC